MKLLDSITVKRPKACRDCLFGSDDSDEGAMCCGIKRDTYVEKDSKGNTFIYSIESPEDALKRECECMFVGPEVPRIK